MVSESARPANRFLIRMGGVGWMVYDRERRGPALIGSDLAASLTREQAERAYDILVGSAGDSE